MEPSALADITSDVQQFVALKDQIALLTNRQKEIKTRLQKAVTDHGDTDGRGHQVLEINDPVSGVNTITNQRRVSKSLDENAAEKILADKDLIEECVEFVPTLNEEAIMAAFYKGQLSEADIDEMFPAKVTYAFII